MEKLLYSTSSLGIGGQTKRRYTDFIVEEIGIGGIVCEVKWFNRNDFMAEPEKLVLTPSPDERTLTHLHLAMEKINKDVNFCTSAISRAIQCSKKRIGYAGLKDKRGVTCQKISIWKPNLSLLEDCRIRGIVLRGDPQWQTERLEIGQLLGNRFTVIIRDLSLKKTELEQRILSSFKEIEANGIANFFGEQRFGGIREVTHLVGKEFVKGNFEQAIMLYLTFPSEREREDISIARKNLAQTGDFCKAVQEFPRDYRFELAILNHLCKNPKDFTGAFAKLSKPLRYLFTHAYQSHLFNKIINKRLELNIGLKPVNGDILSNGIPTAPLIGFDSTFADGKIGELEKSILEGEKIELEQFKIKKMAELSASGARKEIALFPQKLQLLEIGKDEFFEGKLFAKISFELSKGNYATTVLRELCKCEQ